MIGNIIAESPWELARLGKFTASKIDALLTEPKAKSAKDAGELSETAKTYIREKAAELATGTIRKMENFSLEWGNQWEPKCAEILMEKFNQMEYYGKENPVFFPYTDFSGGSPDAISKALLTVFEFKCPENPAIHIGYCLLDSAEELKKCQRDYYHQIQFNMLCVAKELKVDFMDMKGVFASYCPLVRDGYLDLKIIPIPPDAEFKSRIAPAIEKAEAELAAIVQSITMEAKAA